MFSSRKLLCQLVLAVGSAVSARAAIAAWPSNPTNGNVALCTAAYSQSIPAITSDGSGGAIVAWPDYRSTNEAIYVQRVSAAGVPLWTTDGVAVSPFPLAGPPSIASDGAGGAIVTWDDYRSGTDDIYAQRFNVLGTPLWTPNGVAIAKGSGAQRYPQVVSDGAGGAIITWQDYVGYHLYAQRVNAVGVPQWAPNGVAICTAAGGQDLTPNSAIISDGAGGAIITWQDHRGTSLDIYAQRVNAGGVPQWTVDGVPLCTVASTQDAPTLAPDGAGGAIVTWEDFRNVGSGVDIYAQRISATGVPQWAGDGIAACSADAAQYSPTIIADGSGGAIVAWEDHRSLATGSGTYYDIYAQRINAGGAPQWTVDGVAICTALERQKWPMLATDGAGGAIITWQDRRSGDYDIYAQRVTAVGVPQWTVDGVPLCTTVNQQVNPVIISDGLGGAIVTWADARTYSTTNWDIYAQNVNADGTLGGEATPVEVSLVSADAFPDHVSLRWYDPQAGSATVYRADQPEAWKALASLAPDASSIIRYEDAAVVAGSRYGYRLGITTNGAESYVGETWVTVPAAASFALRGSEPNPSVGDLRVSLSLPDDTPANLDLFDLSGRRLESLAIGTLGRGTHVVSLTRGRHELAPGVYSVRLTQGTHRALTRVAILQ